MNIDSNKAIVPVTKGAAKLVPLSSVKPLSGAALVIFIPGPTSPLSPQLLDKVMQVTLA